ncbi:hypothetical protein ROHU_025167 [Labeo rohita]|uniref:Uncharacterized protein n=1 Tax=Labeo rohita TaxID=84645 RepID=A0A498MFX7_LABRO|nr:hypothetical protein ROHU_025167 [Labeo rohita]
MPAKSQGCRLAWDYYYHRTRHVFDEIWSESQKRNDQQQSTTGLPLGIFEEDEDITKTGEEEEHYVTKTWSSNSVVQCYQAKTSSDYCFYHLLRPMEKRSEN